MNNVYDNGEIVLGLVKNVKKYLQQGIATSDMEEEIYEILDYLNELADNAMVTINYDCGMGWNSDTWSKDDIMEVK